MVGLPLESKIALNCEENCVLVCATCNLNEPDGFKKKIWVYLCSIYTPAHMIAWGESCQQYFKTKLPRFWQNLDELSVVC